MTPPSISRSWINELNSRQTPQPIDNRTALGIVLPSSATIVQNTDARPGIPAVGGRDLEQVVVERLCHHTNRLFVRNNSCRKQPTHPKDSTTTQAIWPRDPLVLNNATMRVSQKRLSGHSRSRHISQRLQFLYISGGPACQRSETV